MPSREEKIKEIQRLTKIKEIETLRAQQAAAQAPTPEQAPKVQPSQSALYGASQGLTFGFADEGVAAVKALKDKVTSGGDYRDLYKARVAEERQSLDEARRENPKSYIGGELLGTLPTLAIPGLGALKVAKGAGTAAKVADKALKGASLLGIPKGATIGRAAASAGAQGALMAAGESTADPLESPDKAIDLGMDIAKGAAFGAATQGIFSAGGGLLEKLTPSALRKTAEERAVKAATGQNISALRKMSGTTLNSAGDIAKAEAGLRKKGRDILDEGSLQALDTVEDLAPKLSKGREKYGKLIGEIGTKIDESVPLAVDSQNIAKKMIQYAETIPLTEQGKKLQDRILAESANFEKIGRMSFEDAQKFKNQFQYKPTDADALVSNKDVTNKVRSIIGSEMDDTVEKLAQLGPAETKQLLSQYKVAKSKYGTFKSASDAATDRVQKNLSNRFVSPSDYGVGATAGILSAMGGAQGGDDSKMSSLALGALAAMGNKFARTRGSALAAVTADNIAAALEKSPTLAKKFGEKIIDAANRGPAALTATHQMLMKSPEYKKHFEDDKVERQKQALQRRIGE
jgi:hypothetical protein